MRRFVAISLLSVALAACQDSPTGAPPPGPALSVAASQAAPERVVPGEVLVTVRAGVDVGALARAHGLSVAARGFQDAFVVMRGAAGSERGNAASLVREQGVVIAEPNYLRQVTDVDPRQWAFYNPGGLTIDFTRGRDKGQVVTSLISTADADIDADDMTQNDFAAGGSDVVVGSIDTGVDLGHEEFGLTTLIAGRDWYNDDDDPTDDEGHGTHTTGTMVGSSVGVAGVTGAAPHVSVYVQKVCGSAGCPTSAIVNAINAAVACSGTAECNGHPVVALNLSLGGASESATESAAILAATNAGILVIASAGNSASTVECPACDPNAISVAALNWQDQLTYYSNSGPGLDLSAPGGEMYSNTTEESGIRSSVPGGYAYLQGTSMAAPMVTGTAGIVASKTGLIGAQLRARLEGTADDLGPSGYDETFGHGRVNAYNAVTGSGGGNNGGDTGTLTAVFTYSCRNTDCSFDASASANATNWSWTFGDGGTTSGVRVSHTYTAAGSFPVELTTGDGQTTAQSTQNITCAVRGKRLRCN